MKRKANRSTATGARRVVLDQTARKDPVDDLEYFPTPPWATRALIEVCGFTVTGRRVWEPTCGEGDMALPLDEGRPARLWATDVYDYGFGEVADFHECDAPGDVDDIVFNPPFRPSAAMFLRAMRMARGRVAMFQRLQWQEGEPRYLDIFQHGLIRQIWVFVERVSLVPRRLDPKANLSTCYAWYIADADPDVWGSPAETWWIPPCRNRLERRSDYTRPRPWSGSMLPAPLLDEVEQ